MDDHDLLHCTTTHHQTETDDEVEILDYARFNDRVESRLLLDVVTRGGSWGLGRGDAKAAFDPQCDVARASI